MKEFNLELAKKGHPVCTREGYPARIICWDLKDKDYPIVALIDTYGDEQPSKFTSEGKYSVKLEETAYDLLMAPIKHKGYINVLRTEKSREYMTGCQIFEKEDEAKQEAAKISHIEHIATIPIEWEEECDEEYEQEKTR